MRDAQGQHYWHWCRGADFTARGPGARWDSSAHALRLISHLGSAPETVPPAQTRSAAGGTAIAVDAFGTWAQAAGTGGRLIQAGGVSEPEETIFTGPEGATILDIAPTADGWLLIAMDVGGAGSVVIHDLVDRFADITLDEPGFRADRVAVSENGTIWLLDRAGQTLRQLLGTPLPERVARRRRAAHVFQPEPLNGDAPRLHTPPDLELTGIDEIIDATALADGRLAILTLGSQRRSILRVTDGIELGGPIALAPLGSAYSIATYGSDKLALAVPGSDVAVAVPVPQDADETLPLLGLRLPLRRGTGGRFCKGVPGDALRYPVVPQDSGDGTPAKPFARLVAPSRPSYARTARVAGGIVEADQPRTVWHRLYLEAQLPSGCGVTILLAADDDRLALEALPIDQMHAHRFGTTGSTEGPAGIWLDFDSEKPFIASATGQPRKPDKCGLFSALAQSSEGAVKRIRGRYLRVDLVLHGPGLSTPSVHALRVWGPRAAWRDRYLPKFLSVEEGPLAAGSDFLDRYLSIFEGLLTPLEDQVRDSWRMTRPDAAPADALDWLASWIGAELDGALSDSAKRRMLAESVSLWRRRGTLAGLRKMLEIVTEGGISRGELVVLEHFHLRRTFSTILGADLSDSENPLTPWSASSGNSHLGATFFLGAEDEKSFFALFRPELLDDSLTTPQERQAAMQDLEEFFDQHAFRITVLIHKDMSQTERDLVARVLEREMPAHVQATIQQGPGSLVLALSSFLGVDSRFGPPPPRQDLTVGDAQINQVFLTDRPALDPRYEGGA